MAMKILMAHNQYLLPGGEDTSTIAEAEMLRSAGHVVDLWQTSNASIENKGHLRIGLSAIWSRSAIAELETRLNTGNHDLLHVQNHFPLFSPAIHRIAAKRNVATVQHLRNYRMLCANAGFFRNGKECQDCKDSYAPWRGVLRRCYRDSAAASMVPTAVVAVHKALGTFSQDIDAYIAISEHVRQVHRQFGFPAERIFTRHNAVGRGATAGGLVRERNLLAASRLVPEKGLDILISAWRRRPRDGTLQIAGSGPQEKSLRCQADGDETIHFLGQVQPCQLGGLMRRSRAVVNSCLWSEPFGRTPAEAFSNGTPAIVSATGGLRESVEHRRNGLLVAPGDVDGLDRAITEVLDDDTLFRQLQSGAVDTYRRKFSDAVILPATEKIYDKALRRRRQITGRS